MAQPAIRAGAKLTPEMVDRISAMQARYEQRLHNQAEIITRLLKGAPVEAIRRVVDDVEMTEEDIATIRTWLEGIK